jgi:hypothetical protein
LQIRLRGNVFARAVNGQAVGIEHKFVQHLLRASAALQTPHKVQLKEAHGGLERLELRRQASAPTSTEKERDKQKDEGKEKQQVTKSASGVLVQVAISPPSADDRAKAACHFRVLGACASLAEASAAATAAGATLGGVSPSSSSSSSSASASFGWVDLNAPVMGAVGAGNGAGRLFGVAQAAEHIVSATAGRRYLRPDK